MRSSKFEINIAEKDFKNRNYKFLVQVLDNVWYYAKNKAKKTN